MTTLYLVTMHSAKWCYSSLLSGYQSLRLQSQSSIDIVTVSSHDMTYIMIVNDIEIFDMLLPNITL